MSVDSTPVRWRRARCESGACIEVARRRGQVLVRDSTNPDGAWLAFSPEGWREFIDAVRMGAFEPARAPAPREA